MKTHQRILIVKKDALQTGKSDITALPPELLSDETNQDWILVIDNHEITALKSRSGHGGEYDDRDIVNMIRRGDVP